MAKIRAKSSLFHRIINHSYLVVTLRVTVALRVLSSLTNGMTLGSLLEACLQSCARSWVHTRRQETGDSEITEQGQVSHLATHLQMQGNKCNVIKYIVLILYPSLSTPQVSLYGPPLNQPCQDDLPHTSNIPLYQTQASLSGVHLLNHARVTFTVQ